MEPYKQAFIEFLVRAKALKFGEFRLKSGRTAPYFISMGSFSTGEAAVKLGHFYAEALTRSGFDFDVIFGPAYKGIPLCVLTASALFSDFGRNVSYVFNRKEAKSYGEKDAMVGAALSESSRVVLVDDVVTAGTAIRESMSALKNNGNPRISGVLIAVDRQEKNNDGENAILALEKLLDVSVRAIVTLNEIVSYLYKKDIDGIVYIDDEKKRAIEEYRMKYGIDSE
ncbi:orotate phosphoribosyltransferase [Candidatus Peregrinibacteria bacterium]|nr:orotate phosphoribosyltransferase [Candidatus Peregrinibacteria bacterium]